MQPNVCYVFAKRYAGNLLEDARKVIIGNVLLVRNGMELQIVRIMGVDIFQYMADSLIGVFLALGMHRLFGKKIITN